MQLNIELGADSGHPHVPVMINGKGPYTFVLDTGASVTMISKSLVEELGIQTYEGEKKKARGVERKSSQSERQSYTQWASALCKSKMKRLV